MNFLQDLDNDVIIHKIGLYSVKRYGYTKNNFVDNDGKRINERVFSFILMRGKKWFNSTHLNFRESKLDEVIPAYEKIFLEIQNKRREELTVERSLRKMFPIKHEFIFGNVTVVAIEKNCYYNSGIPSTNGVYFESTEKIVEFYANGKPFRKNICTNIDCIVDVDFVLRNTINNEIKHNYDVNDFNETYYKSNIIKLNFQYIPLLAIIGYCYKFDGKVYEFYNFHYSSKHGLVFETQYENSTKIPLAKFMKGAKPVGELQGAKAWRSLLNKIKCPG
jgi:hypothetical protein